MGTPVHAILVSKRATMFKSLLETAKSSPFASPFQAKCEGLKINESREIQAAAPAEEYSCEFGDSKYYALCGLGGVLSCGITHTAVVPLDLVKCRIQVDPAKYGGLINGFKVTMAESGLREFGKGWAPTLIGYSMQGLCKFGFYEVFKNLYGGMMGEENAYVYRTSLYLVASASAEFFADIALCPMEAVKVRVQTKPGWANNLREGFPKFLAEEGWGGFYKGIVPLWGRQIPYTMMKFACFEKTVEALYKYVVPKPRADCSKSEQLVVTFVAVAKNLGFAGMWKGLGPRIIMIGILTALQWFIYDSVKVAFRLPRPPPPEMPASLKAKLEAQKS